MAQTQFESSQVADEIITIVADRTGGNVLPELTDSLDELGIDSMGLLDIAFAVEERFKIELSYNANTEGFATVGDLVKVVEGLVGGGAAST